MTAESKKLVTKMLSSGYLEPISLDPAENEEALHHDARITHEQREVIRLQREAIEKALSECCDLIGTDAGNALIHASRMSKPFLED